MDEVSKEKEEEAGQVGLVAIAKIIAVQKRGNEELEERMRKSDVVCNLEKFSLPH